MLWKNITAYLFAGLPLQYAAMPSPASTSEVQTQAPVHQNNVQYEAPLREHGSPESIVPGFYGVYLFPGHSIEQHSAAIKTDLTPYITHIFDKLYTDRVVYSARNVDNSLLAAIRSDLGVEYVTYDYSVEIDLAG